ncbi:hypothetical protein Tco_1124432 [Tanacetum coccineum]|uniref:Transposase (Putative), gypsy type n=1 Tax=Tanacetum coccineum TaxID=301880 RepID=A0ABQ5J639_9ASTR
MVTHTIDTVTSVLTQRELDHFYNTYNISANLGSELHGREDTIRDAPVGKIGIYTRFLKFANFRVPLSRFLLRVLEYYQINFSQLFVLGATKVSHFEIMYRVLSYRPSLDPLPSDDRINAELLALLDHHRTIIRWYPKTFLCLVGLSRSFDDALVRPTLLHDDGSDMGLLDFVKSADPFKVKTRERTLAEGEVPLNNETVNMIVLPSADIIQIVNHTIVDERLRSDAASAFEAVPTNSGKSPTTLNRLELQSKLGGFGSSSVSPPVEEFVSSSVTPTPEPDAYEGSGSSQDGGVRTRRASMGIVVSSSSGPEDEVAAPRVEDISIGSEFRLRYEHEIMTKEKFQKKFADTYAVVQHRDAKITILRTRLEKAEHDVAEVIHSVVVSLTLESKRGELKRHVIKLGGDCERLWKKAAGEAKLREELKSFEDAEARRFEQKSAELDARIADVRRDMDNNLYPHMFTAIVGRRWLLSHGVRLAVMKCAQSAKCQSALGKVITLAVNKGIQEGLEAGTKHGRSGRTLARSSSVSDEVLLSEVILTVRVAAEKRGLCPPLLAGASGSVPLPGLSLGVADYQVFFDDRGSATQPPIVQAHDDLFDTSVLDGVGA